MAIKKYSVLYFILGLGLLFVLYSFSQNGRYNLSESNRYVIDSQTGDVYYRENRMKGERKVNVKIIY